MLFGIPILINKLENVQVEAARIVTGGTRLVSLSNLYIETGRKKMKDRREKHSAIQFYKMSNNLTPQYLSNLIPQNFTYSSSTHSNIALRKLFRTLRCTTMEPTARKY